MNKVKVFFCIIILFVFIISICYVNKWVKQSSVVNLEDKNNQSIEEKKVWHPGWLTTRKSSLVDEEGKKIQLRGLSSHGIQWYSDLITYDNLKMLKDSWKINVFRIAMYTDANVSGYIAHPEKSKEQVDKIVKYAKDLDLYVIIDWHILKDGNPQTYKEQAVSFFSEMSKKYADVPNVIYEICNEPNGKNVTWGDCVKPYAEEIISIIRQNSPKSLIIVGTTNWCRDLELVIDNPLNYENVMYSCHFYAGSHGEELQKQIDKCIDNDIPIFVSECGITDQSGNGAIYVEKYKEWIEFLNKRNISWIYWSFCNKDESSSVLKKEYSLNKQIDDTEELQNQDDYEIRNVPKINDYLTEPGVIIRELLTATGRKL